MHTVAIETWALLSLLVFPVALFATDNIVAVKPANMSSVTISNT